MFNLTHDDSSSVDLLVSDRGSKWRLSFRFNQDHRRDEIFNIDLTASELAALIGYLKNVKH